MESLNINIILNNNDMSIKVLSYMTMNKARYVYKAKILMTFHILNNIQWWVGKFWVNDSHAVLKAFPFILHLSLLCDDID